MCRNAMKRNVHHKMHVYPIICMNCCLEKQGTCEKATTNAHQCPEVDQELFFCPFAVVCLPIFHGFEVYKVIIIYNLSGPTWTLQSSTFCWLLAMTKNSWSDQK